MRRTLFLMALALSSALTVADAQAGPFRRWVPIRHVYVPPQTARGVLHSHTCPRCGNVWWHDDSSFGKPQDHTCKRCGYGPVWHKSGH